MRVRAGRGGMRIEAESVAALRGWVASPSASRDTRRLTVVVESWQPPRPGWSGELGPVPGLIRHDIQLESDRVTVRLRLARPTPLQLLLGAVLDVLRPRRRTPASVSVDIASYGPQPAWLPPAQNTAGFVGRDPDEEKVRPYDVLLVDARQAADRYVAAGAVAVRAEATGVALAGGHAILVDPALTPGGSAIGPRSYGRPDPEGRIGELTGEDPPREAAELVRLALAGAVPHLPKLPEPTAALLAGELVAILTEEPPSADDALGVEVRGVRQRRAALRHHATGTAIASVLGVLPPHPPRVTALLVPTRPELVLAALAALAAQTYPELEIVLGLAGGQLTEAVASAVATCGRPVEALDIAEVDGIDRLASATAHARGPLVTRIDEAAIYGPEHVWDLVLARQYSGATLVGKGAEFTHHAGVTVRRRMLLAGAYTTTVSPGSMLIALGDLESLGGWDRLATRVRHEGGLTYRTHPLGYVRLTPSPVPRHPTSQWTGLPPYPEFGRLPRADHAPTVDEER